MVLSCVQSHVFHRYGIPRCTLNDWVVGRRSGKKRGPKPVLSHNDQRKLVDHEKRSQKFGLSDKGLQLQKKIADYATLTQGENPFKQGIPSEYDLTECG